MHIKAQERRCPGAPRRNRIFFVVCSRISPAYFRLITSSVNDPGFIVRRGRCSPAAGGVTSISAVTRYTVWVSVSSAMVRAYFCVSAFCTTENLSAGSSRTTVSVPSPFELNAKLVPGSNALASTPSPIGTVVTTFPVSAFTMAITLLWHPAKSRRSEEHTSELQSQFHLVCRLLLE